MEEFPFIQLSTAHLGTVRLNAVGSGKSIKSRRGWGFGPDWQLQHRWLGYQQTCGGLGVLTYTSYLGDTPTLGHWRSHPSRLNNGWLTRGRLVAIVSMSEVLGILHHWDASHPYDNRIWTRIQSTWGDNPVVDVMKRAGGVFLTTDDSNRTWKDTQR